MERHKCCKLCSRTFPNGRALGGHMKAHLATFPLPPKPPQQPPPLLPSSESSSSFSSFSESEPEDKAGLVYGLRENPKKSFRVADPEFSSFPAPPPPPPPLSAPDSVAAVQDRESETESSKNPTRQRSKRTRRTGSILHSRSFKKEDDDDGDKHEDERLKKKQPKLGFMESPQQSEEHEQQEPVSSVSETSVVEDVAMFLVMLSRDTWHNKNNAVQVIKQDHEEREEEVERSRDEKEIKITKKVRVRGRHSHQCENCSKTFRSSRALGSHRSICCEGGGSGRSSDRIFECPFCFKIFGSGQALGGHKRSHLIAMAAPSSSSSAAKHSFVFKNSGAKTFIDLNLPAPQEEQDEDDFGVVSDVSDA